MEIFCSGNNPSIRDSMRPPLRRIILPQALKRTLPPSANEAITLVKDTALVVVIGMGEMLRSAKEIFTRDFSITPFVIAAIFYLLLTSVVISVFRTLEKNWRCTTNGNSDAYQCSQIFRQYKSGGWSRSGSKCWRSSESPEVAGDGIPALQSLSS